ncbi:MAG TPA: hypothetical protein VNK95_03085, partial [Caldilineaceae bacterium]|nr:hypothetical protein [Caldilineaceae bacterium]
MRRLRGGPRRLLLLLALGAGIGWCFGALLPAGRDTAPAAGQEPVAEPTPLPATPTPSGTSPFSIEATPRAAPTEERAGAFVSRELVATTLAAPLARQPDGPAGGVALSADGRWLAFSSRAGNLSPAIQDANGYDDVYLYDRETGELTLVSAGSEGGSGDGGSGPPALSPDGRFVAFYAWAGNLTADDSNAVQDAFLYDRVAGTLERVSVSGDGGQANGRAGDAGGARPALSWDGRQVAFHAEATNLVADDRNGVADV